jgi:E3 ubiquitin-protein ligase RNF14
MRSETTQGLHLSLSTFPPLHLHVVLPPAYPLYVPPEITSLCAAHSWLPQLYIRALQQNLLSLWKADIVLYDWVEYIRNAEFLKFLGLSAIDADGVIRFVNLLFMHAY